jgi:hypothetical protein
MIESSAIRQQKSSAGIDCLLRQDNQLSMRVESLLATHLLRHTTALHNAIKTVWPPYETGSNWAAMSSPAGRWWRAQTKGSETKGSRTVHFNILDGTLLIDGKTLGKLPANYMAHSSYRKLFGSMVCHLLCRNNIDLYFTVLRREPINRKRNGV